MAQVIQLTFEPAYDAYHTMFRVARLFPVIGKERVEYDKLRIMDFYLCFPELIDQLRLKQEHRRFRQLVRLRQGLYSGKPDGRLAFNRMQPTQSAAVQTLALDGYLAGEPLELGWVEATGKPSPADLDVRVQQLNAEERPLIEFMEVLLREYPLIGDNGLKHRSALMEHRYDVA